MNNIKILIITCFSIFNDHMSLNDKQITDTIKKNINFKVVDIKDMYKQELDKFDIIIADTWLDILRVNNYNYKIVGSPIFISVTAKNKFPDSIIVRTIKEL